MSSLSETCNLSTFEAQQILAQIDACAQSSKYLVNDHQASACITVIFGYNYHNCFGLFMGSTSTLVLSHHRLIFLHLKISEPTGRPQASASLSPKRLDLDYPPSSSSTTGPNGQPTKTSSDLAWCEQPCAIIVLSLVAIIIISIVIVIILFIKKRKHRSSVSLSSDVPQESPLPSLLSIQPPPLKSILTHQGLGLGRDREQSFLIAFLHELFMSGVSLTMFGPGTNQDVPVKINGKKKEVLQQIRVQGNRKKNV